MTLLGSIFAMLALALALIGLYGVLAHGVTLRTHEIGVRLALGAAPERVLRMVVGDALKLVGVGLVAGLVGALALGKLLQGALYGVAPWDPVTFLLAPMAFLLTALGAALIPARRAARVSPMETLRDEG
jgi:putative ABC transport system permease protein